MPSALKHAQRIVLKLKDFLKEYMMLRRPKTKPQSLICDSKSVALCFACHSFRDKLMGTKTVQKGLPTVIDFQKQSFVLWQRPQSYVKGKSAAITIAYGEKVDEDLLKKLSIP